jgi:hypothetical protein
MSVRTARRGTTWRRRALLAALLTIALAVLGVLLGGPATAAAPAITVTPSSGLTDGQSVSVHGTGFTANAKDINIVECPASGASQNACNIAGGQFFQSTDGSGSFTVAIAVKEKYGSIDCTKITCMVVAHEGTNPNSGNTGQENIHFGPTTSPSTPGGGGTTTGSGGTGGTGGSGSTGSNTGGGPTGANTGHVDLGAPRIALSLWLAGGGVLLLGIGIAVQLRRSRLAK